MKKILLIYTGGTICSLADGEMRRLDGEGAKSVLLKNFQESPSPLAPLWEELFEDSHFPEEEQTLSENMTVEKLDRIAKHLASFFLEDYQGIMILHGTDTLAFSANLFSFLFSAAPVPILFISGNRPPADPESNANANFRCGAELLAAGELPPGVYVPYRNRDGKIYLHRGSTILPCRNFSDDFENASGKNVCSPKAPFRERMFRRTLPYRCKKLQEDSVLLLEPYPGLNYQRIDLARIKAVVHGAYHSGTACVSPREKYSLHALAKHCEEEKIPLFLCPSKLGPDQYETAFHIARETKTVLIQTPTVSAYAKALAGISMGLERERLVSFMKEDLAREIL